MARPLDNVKVRGLIWYSPQAICTPCRHISAPPWQRRYLPSCSWFSLSPFSPVEHKRKMQIHHVICSGGHVSRLCDCLLCGKKYNSSAASVYIQNLSESETVKILQIKATDVEKFGTTASDRRTRFSAGYINTYCTQSSRLASNRKSWVPLLPSNCYGIMPTCKTVLR